MRLSSSGRDDPSGSSSGIPAVLTPALTTSSDVVVPPVDRHRLVRWSPCGQRERQVAER
jgi:hypothetical protein